MVEIDEGVKFLCEIVDQFSKFEYFQLPWLFEVGVFIVRIGCS